MASLKQPVASFSLIFGFLNLVGFVYLRFRIRTIKFFKNYIKIGFKKFSYSDIKSIKKTKHFRSSNKNNVAADYKLIMKNGKKYFFKNPYRLELLGFNKTKNKGMKYELFNRNLLKIKEYYKIN